MKNIKNYLFTFILFTATLWLALPTPLQAQLVNPVKDSSIVFTDITTNNFSTTKHGFVPKGTGLGYVLRDDGNWVSATSAVTNLTNSNISASAAIDYSKLADLTASRLLTSNSTGDVSATAVTFTEASFLSGVTSSLCGINQACTQTNKTFTSATLNNGTASGTNLVNGSVSGSTITVNDNVLTLQDNTTPTKKMQYELSGITAGQTRTITQPDFSYTPAAINQAQTWTAMPTFGSGIAAASATITTPLGLASGGTNRSSALFRAEGSFTGGNFDLGTSAQASYIEMINASMTFTPISGSAAISTMCSTTNAATAPSTSSSTCAAGSESNGVNFTILRTGLHRVCVDFVAYAQSGSNANLNVSDFFQLIETPTNAQTQTTNTKAMAWASTIGPIAATTNLVTGAITLCRNFNFGTTGTKGIRLMYMMSAATAANGHIILADNTNSRAVVWSVEELGQ
jgi:hypothetical protein